MKSSSNQSLAAGSARQLRSLVRNLLCLVCLAALAIPAGADISGTVFRDVDADGVEDAGEAGIIGITVNAFADGAGAPTATATTDINGDYTLTLGAGDYRIEVGNSSATATFQSGPAGTTRVTFATNGATGIDVGLFNPLQYCQSNPDLVTNCYIDGDQDSTDDVLISLAYTESGESDTATIGHEAQAMQIGTTWGLAYNRTADILFAGSHSKRHAGYGDQDTGTAGIQAGADATGTIWQIPNPSDGVVNGGADAPQEFVNLNDLFVGNPFGTNTHPIPGTDMNTDNASYAAVGKTSIGDMDISDDDLTLWLVNMESRELWEVSLGSDPANPAVPTAGDIDTFALDGLYDCEGDGGASHPDLRPFGVKFHDGRVYVGAVCTTETAGDADDSGLRALVFRFNPLTDTFDAAPAVDFLLTYDRGCLLSDTGTCLGGVGSNSANWQGWEDDFDSTSSPRQPEGTVVLATAELGYPQPMLADIEFADDGTMILGIRDRWGDQLGRNETFPDGTSVGVGDADAVGDILRAQDTDGDGVYVVSTVEATAGTEFFADDDWTDTRYAHDEVVNGGLAVWAADPGGDVAATVMDPIDGSSAFVNDFSAGLRWFDLATGTTDRRLEVYDPDNAGPDVFFGKANGLGDLEAICNASPIEIGNRVWNDLDMDGVQDPGEPGINGVTVFLFEDPNGVPNSGDEVAAGSVVTSGDGNFIFTVDPGTNYYVQLAIPSAFRETTLDSTQIGDGNDDVRDSDGQTGFVVGAVVAPFTTGGPGGNDHTIDLGFFALEFDWGDLPDGPYPTLAASSGANHEITSPGNVYLGGAPDSELNGQPSADGLGDDTDLDGDDEDGVLFLHPLVPGYSADIDVTTSGAGFLSAFIDFNSDGDFADTGETLASDLAVGAGTTTLNIASVPAGATGTMAARFRITNAAGQGGASPTGSATTGEVEDYVLGCIGDFVWSDLDGDGIQDGGAEVGIVGATVNLVNPGFPYLPVVDANGLPISTTTDASGLYSFCGLPTVENSGRTSPGDYRILFDLPAGFTDFSPPNTTGDALDSDADQDAFGTGLEGLAPLPALAPVTINSGETDDTVDAGARAITAALITSAAAYADGGSVVFEFATGYEALTAGFSLFRFDASLGTYVEVTERPVSALLGAPQGGVYRIVDADAPFAKEFGYMVVEHQLDGKTRAYGPFVVELEARGRRPEVESAVSVRPHASDRLKRRLASSRKAAASSRGKAASRNSGFADTGRAQYTALVSVRESGLHAVTAAELAATLGIPEGKLSEAVRRHEVVVENRGEPVAWFPAADGDSLFFYGEAIDSLYTLDNTYWLRVGAPGVPMEASSGSAVTAQPGGVFRSTERYEEDVMAAINSTLESGVDYWFWNGMNVNSSDRIRTFDLAVPDVMAGDATLRVELAGATNGTPYYDHHAIVRINGVEVGTTAWGGFQRHVATMSFDSSLLTPLTTVEIEGTLEGGSTQSIFFIDSFEIDYPRAYQADADRLVLTGDGNGTVTVEGLTTADVEVFDLTDPNLPLKVTDVLVESAGGAFRASFEPADASTPYLVTTLSAARAVSDPRPYAPAIELTAAHHRFEHVVIAPQAWMSEAAELAAYHQSQGLSSLAVSVEEVYNAFSWGNVTPWAIRDFLAYARANWSDGPDYAVLAGRGTFDHRDLFGDGDSFLPVVMVGTAYGLVSTDNVLADLVGGDSVPEVAIGRLPIVSGAELATYLEKLEAYEASSGPWRGRALILADDADPAGDFPLQSDVVADLLTSYKQQLIYLSEMDIDTARAQLQAAWNDGSQVVNYIGHGGVTQLANEGLLRTLDMNLLANGERLPVVSALTCVVGRSDIPGIESLAEALVTDSDGGAMAVWAPTTVSLSGPAHELNVAYVTSLEAAPAGTALGDIVLEALERFGKAGGSVEMLNAYAIAGDPAVQLP